MTCFRVLVADDEPLARRMIAALLQGDHEIETIAECGDERAVQEAIHRQRPDIVFLDIEMPEVTGLDLARELSEDGPVVVFVTAFSRDAPQAFEVNASDYVSSLSPISASARRSPGQNDACASAGWEIWRFSLRPCLPS
jgi:two-component system LytT family response regulator